ncbi:MAG TPA: hypothetical protein VFH94_14230, partial [Streptomyces sp.]|nr:hypothetical protein [Streptomyces sp.]
MRRFKRTLAAVAVAVTVVSGTAGWVSGNAQVAVTGAPPGSAAWRAEGLPDPAAARPGEVARFFKRLSADRRQDLVRRHPSVVG